MHANSAVSPLAPVIDFQMPCLFLFINGLKAKAFSINILNIFNILWKKILNGWAGPNGFT